MDRYFVSFEFSEPQPTNLILVGSELGIDVQSAYREEGIGADISISWHDTHSVKLRMKV
jgi:hypothetical protein